MNNDSVRFKTLLLTLALVGTSLDTSAETTAVRFGDLVTEAGAPIKDAVVLVDNDRITKVGTGDGAIPRGSRVLDLRPLTGIPGMIDVHVHMTYYWDQAPGSRPWTQFGSLGVPVTVFLAQENARKTLETGVTTVRDLGANEGTSFAMRELISRNAMIGPRMFVAGCGLHIPDDPLGTDDDPYRRSGAIESDPCLVDGVPEVERAARQQIAAGADWVKMFGSVGYGSDVRGFQTFGYDEIKAAADAAHRAGKKLAVHSYGPEGARDAVSAGADSIEHAIEIDDSTFVKMAKRGIVYVPTIHHNRYYIEHKDEYGYGQADVDRLNEFIRKNMETLRRAIHFHVKIAMGSDAVFTAFGENTRELDRFVDAGMTPEQALQSATTVGAELLGKSNELGTVAPGAFADLVAVDGDPLQDLVAIHKVKWVMKGGKVVVEKR